MYYESRSYEILPISTNFDELVNKINSSSAHQVATIKNSKKETIAFVPDGHINNPKAELAILNLSTGCQIESLTWAWVDKNHALELKKVADSQMKLRPAQLNQFDQSASFTCACCGDSFTSTYNEQKQYDQDDGFGYCEEHA